jgi:hypothetical protein
VEWPSCQWSEDKSAAKFELESTTILRVVNSGEKFGLVASDDATSFGGLFSSDIKKEEPREELPDHAILLSDSRPSLSISNRETCLINDR